MIGDRNRRNDKSPRPGRWPIFPALAAQMIAGGLVLAGGRMLAVTGVVAAATTATAATLAIVAAQGLLAASIGWGFGLRRWWPVIQIAIPVAIWGALVLALPAWVHLAAFFALLLVFSGAARDRVPLFLSNRRTVAALADLCPKGRTFRFIDLGCGLAGPLRQLAATHPAGEFTGIETAPVSFVIAWLRCLGSNNAHVRFGDLWRSNLTDEDMVYCFLSPQPMPALYRKAAAQMKPGSLLISNSFAVPDHPPHHQIEVADSRRTKLLLWRM